MHVCIPGPYSAKWRHQKLQSRVVLSHAMPQAKVGLHELESGFAKKKHGPPCIFPQVILVFTIYL